MNTLKIAIEPSAITEILRRVISAIVHSETSPIKCKSFYCRLANYILSSLQVRLWAGIYFIHLQEWLRVFPKSQILIFRFEDYIKSRFRTSLQVFDFLTLGTYRRRFHLN